jgi:phosphatidylglycerophosphatase C
MIRLAAFDLDGTLTTRDCVVPFLRRVAGAPTIARHLARHARQTGGAVLHRRRDELKAAAAVAAFRGRRLEAIEAQGAEFAEIVHRQWLRPDTAGVLAGHRARGDRTVIVSASFEVYARPLGVLLGVDDVLATRLEAVDGVLTGRLAGGNCRGAEKVARVGSWLAEHELSRDEVVLVAYGDSAGDRQLLEAADEPHWMGRRRR